MPSPHAPCLLKIEILETKFFWGWGLGGATFDHFWSKQHCLVRLGKWLHRVQNKHNVRSHNIWHVPTERIMNAIGSFLFKVFFIFLILFFFVDCFRLSAKKTPKRNEMTLCSLQAIFSLKWSDASWSWQRTNQHLSYKMAKIKICGKKSWAKNCIDQFVISSERQKKWIPERNYKSLESIFS